MQSKIKIKMKYFIIFYITLIVSLSAAVSAEEVIHDEVPTSEIQVENQCDSVTYREMQPFLHYIQHKMDTHDNFIESRDRKIRELEVKLAVVESANVEKDKTIDILRENVQLITKSVEPAKQQTDQLTILNQKIAAHLKTINEQRSQIVKLQAQVERDVKCKNRLVDHMDALKKYREQISHQQSYLEGKVDSCIPFAYSPGVHNIKLPGLRPFKVLCDSAAEEKGWIVIQQRINGKEDFFRNWATYRTGFGSASGDFFLGLEKIYRLTSSQPFELYIYLENFAGKIVYARYDSFAIAGEADQYRLISVDGMSGNATQDNMKNHKGHRFRTFDRDSVSGIANLCHGGWWYGINATDSNLNGKYFEHEVRSDASNFWYDYYSLKKVQMLIRPKFD